MYKDILNAISFAIQEVRNAKKEVSCISGNEEIDIEAYSMLAKVEEALESAEQMMEPF